MGAFQNYPYSDVHQLNLDWIIKEVKEVKDRTDEIDQAVADSQGYAETAQESAENASQSAEDASESLDTVREEIAEWENGVTSLKNQVVSNSNEIAVQTARIDEIISGSTADPDAELLDIRVGYDSTVYSSAGDAVRDQVSDLHTIDDYLSIPTRNLFNPLSMTGSGITISGNTISGTGTDLSQFRTDGIPTGITYESNTVYTWSMYCQNIGSTTTGNGINIRFVHSDNSEKVTYIPNSTTSRTRYSVISTSNKTVSKIYISYSSAPSNTWVIDNIQLEKGTSPSDFIPYFSARDYALKEEMDSGFTNVENNYIHSSGVADINSSNYTNYWSSVNDQPLNTVYLYSSNLTQQMVSDLPAYNLLLTIITYGQFKFANNANKYGHCQLAMTPEGVLFSRFLKYDGSPSGAWTDWNRHSGGTSFTEEKINCLGDSFTEPLSAWWREVGFKTGATMNNYGVASSRITKDYIDSGGNLVRSFINRAVNMDSTASVNIIFGGINDTSELMGGGITLGNINSIPDSSGGSFYGGLKYLIEEIFNLNPASQIIGIIPPDFANSPADYINRKPYLEQIQQACREVYAYYGIPYVDLKRECQQMYINDYNINTYRQCDTSTSTYNYHPSALGSKFIGRLICSKGIFEIFG